MSSTNDLVIKQVKKNTSHDINTLFMYIIQNQKRQKKRENFGLFRGSDRERDTLSMHDFNNTT